MTTKYDHIELGRAFRPVVLAHLKALSDWPKYMTDMGWNGRSEGLKGAEIRAACEALSVDLEALRARFLAAPATLDAAALENIATDERIETMLHATAPAGEGAGFEGADVEETIAQALAEASPHMTPYLANMMPGLIRPLVEAAVRGPRTIVKTVTAPSAIGAGNGAAQGAAAPVIVNVLRRSPLGRTFDLRRNEGGALWTHILQTTYVDVCDYADAPAVDPDYIWSPEVLAQLAAQDVSGLNAWLYGPAGVGKTDGVEQYAARLGRPFVRIAIERTTEPTELIGQMMLAKDGGMAWGDGKLTAAFRVPRCVILIDEPTLLRSGTLAVLQTALDKRRLWLASGEVVDAAPRVFIVAADNTNGCGDDSGRYVDTAPVNAAFLDRFAMRTEVSYLTASQETGMLSHRAGVHPAVARIMVDYANLTRASADSGKLTMGVTPRRLLAWARTVRVGVPSAKAFHSIVIAAAAPEDRATLEQLATTSLATGHDQIDGITRGKIDPNAPAPDPRAQGAVGATALQFPDDADTL